MGVLTKALHDIHDFAFWLVFTSLAFGKRIPCSMWVLFVWVCIFNQVIDWWPFREGRRVQYSGWTGKTLTVWQVSPSGFYMITDEVDKGELLFCYRFMSNFHSYLLLVQTDACLGVSIDLMSLTTKVESRFISPPSTSQSKTVHKCFVVIEEFN